MAEWVTCTSRFTSRFDPMKLTLQVFFKIQAEMATSMGGLGKKIAKILGFQGAETPKSIKNYPNQPKKY